MKVFEERNTVSALFLDIKNANDNVHCGTSVDRLKVVGYSGSLLASIYYLVSSRDLEANYAWLDLKDCSYKGLHQVSVLSPTSFYSVSRHSRIGVSEVELCIQIIGNYLKESGLEIAPKECHCVFSIKYGQRMENVKSWYKGKG
jgi:hypothetical protein